MIFPKALVRLHIYEYMEQNDIDTAQKFLDKLEPMHSYIKENLGDRFTVTVDQFKHIAIEQYMMSQMKMNFYYSRQETHDL